MKKFLAKEEFFMPGEEMNFITNNINFISQYGYAFLIGALKTIEISFISIICGMILGTFLALMKLSKSHILKLISTAYIEIIRGTPMLVQITIVYFGLKAVIPENLTFFRSTIFLCSLAISVNSAAYVAEVIRGGIQSVEKGQMEGARSLGLTEAQAMKHIIIPQAIKNILPALVNEFISLIKESSVVFTVGITDLFYVGKNLQSTLFNTKPLYFAALIYLLITFSLSKTMGLLERKLSHD